MDHRNSGMDDHHDHHGGAVTYEATHARRSAGSLADKVHWDERMSFRGQPYRHLHHQRGLIGTFTVRLLEARKLRRSYWSALALGPVKHLGFSKAHGQVSSFCSFYLDFEQEEEDYYNSQDDDDSDEDEGEAKYQEYGDNDNGVGRVFQSSPTPLTPRKSSSSSSLDQKPAAKPSINNNNNNTKQTLNQGAPAAGNSMIPPDAQVVTSPVISSNDNPVWDNCQLELPLRKGAMTDGSQRIQLQIRVQEDATAMDNLLGPGDDGRLLGMGALDVTPLCLGQTMTGQALPGGMMESWITISLPNNENNNNNNDDSLKPQANNSNATGHVRVLISYEPNGMEPQKHDVVALEAFCRRPTSTSSCRPILSPSFMPMTVLDRRGSYLLLLAAGTNARTSIVRLHRNALFVVERQNWVDAAQNALWTPTDVVLSTPVGRELTTWAAPMVQAGKELCMPALLSLKLFWLALRTTTIASLSGVQALGATFMEEGTNSLMSNNTNATTNNNNNNATARRGGGEQGGNARTQARSSASMRKSTVKFVQL